MYVIQIPTNKPVVRKDYGDLLFATAEGKYNAIVKEIKERHASGQPVLVGTVAVETSELLSQKLRKEHIPHEVLNAKNNEREADIIANAGQKGAVTIATNMAGRGTDIKLGEGVTELGGLCVIGTERHEARRIDNQLRGRSGRQGDPGMSQFFVSFEDDLMRRFGTDRVKNMLTNLGLADDQPIRSRSLTKSIESAQRKVEGNNYDIRKNLLDYDNVLNQQREIIYARRNEILDQESIHDRVLETFKNTVQSIIDDHIPPEGYLTENDMQEIAEYVNTNFLKNSNLKYDDIKDMKPDELVDYLDDLLIKDYGHKRIDTPLMNEFEKAISLRVIDSK